jgi:hypothetical protein
MHSFVASCSRSFLLDFCAGVTLVEPLECAWQPLPFCDAIAACSSFTNRGNCGRARHAMCHAFHPLGLSTLATLAALPDALQPPTSHTAFGAQVATQRAAQQARSYRHVRAMASNGDAPAEPALTKLRQLMAAADGGKGVAAYIIPSEDPHMSEYTPDVFKRREFISK